MTIVLIALMIPWASAIRAEFLELEASQIVTIQPADKASSPRVLVQWSLPKDLSGKIIDAAVVTLTVPYEGAAPFEVHVHRVTRAWDAEAVEWSEGWSRGGGDFDDGLPSPAIITDRNGGKISADVYFAILDQISGKSDHFGFIVIPEEDTEARISSITPNAEAKLADAKLIIAYRERR
jgi:hypothetical protein